jgi:hypothetical protein
MNNLTLKDNLTDLLDTNEVYRLNDVASELFRSNPSSDTLQLHSILNKDQYKRAEKLYSEAELDSIQNIIDVFINSLR